MRTNSHWVQLVDVLASKVYTVSSHLISEEDKERLYTECAYIEIHDANHYLMIRDVIFIN